MAIDDNAAANPEGFTSDELAAWNSQISGTEGPQVAETTPPAGAPEPQRTSAETPEAPSPVGAAVPGQPKEPPAPSAAAPGEEEDAVEEVATPGGKPRRMVNYGALHKTRMDLKREREERAADRTELTKAREERTRLDERLRLLSEAMTPPAAKEAPPPDPEKDIFGYVRHLEGQIRQLGGAQAETTQAAQEQRTEQEVLSTYQGDAAQFAQQQPDFAQAYQHLLRTRDAMLQSIGYDDAQERAKIIRTEERNLVMRALKAGKSPAAAIYGVSKSLGYQLAAPSPAPAPAPQPGQPQPAQNGQPAPAAQPKAPSAAEEITRLQNGQRAAKSLSIGGGGAPQALTAEMLINMSEDEFGKMLRKFPTQVNELMGAA